MASSASSGRSKVSIVQVVQLVQKAPREHAPKASSNPYYPQPTHILLPCCPHPPTRERIGMGGSNEVAANLRRLPVRARGAIGYIPEAAVPFHVDLCDRIGVALHSARCREVDTYPETSIRRAQLDSTRGRSSVIIVQRKILRFAGPVVVALVIMSPRLAVGQTRLDEDLDTARTMALGGRAEATSSSTAAMFGNPAAIAAVRGYQTEAIALYDPSINRWGLGTALIDSTRQYISAGLAYVYQNWGGPYNAHESHDTRLNATISLSQRDLHRRNNSLSLLDGLARRR